MEPGNGLRVVDVWDGSARPETRIGPAVEAMMADRGTGMPAQLEPRITEAFDVVRGKNLA